MTVAEANERFNSDKRRRQPWFRYRRMSQDGKIRSATTSRNYVRVDWERTFADHSSGTYRSKSCSFASRRFKIQQARLEEIHGEKPRSEAEHSRLWKEYYRELTPGFSSEVGILARKELRKNKNWKERLYGPRHSAGTSRGKTIAAWCKPPKRPLTLCPVCGEFTHVTRFHPACYNSVRGQVKKGVVFSSHKPGPAADEKKLTRAFCWAVRLLAHGETINGIAKDAREDPSYVRREIKRILPLVPQPGKANGSFGKIALIVREEAAKRGLNLEFSSESSQIALNG